MDNPEEFFQTLYQNFNNRAIEAVIEHLGENVQWANGMDGGYVYGHNGVRDYWTRQFKTVNSNVTPIGVAFYNDSATVKVRQVVKDLNGNLLSEDIVYHIFQLEGDKVAAFHIGEKLKP